MPSVNRVGLAICISPFRVHLEHTETWRKLDDHRYLPWNLALRRSLKALIPSLQSSVLKQRLCI